MSRAIVGTAQPRVTRLGDHASMHPSQVRSLREFSLSSSNQHEIGVILSDAMRLLCEAFPYDIGVAVLASAHSKELTFALFENHTTQGFQTRRDIDPQLLFQWTAQSGDAPMFWDIHSPSSDASFSKAHRFLTPIISRLKPELYTELFQSNTLLVPLYAKGEALAGFLIVGRQSSTRLTAHSKFPSEKELPFLSLLKSQVQASISNTITPHRRIPNRHS